jgi:hypothetical protein
MSEFNLTRIDRLRYRPTKTAEDFLGLVRQSLMPGDKAAVARLAVARSLSTPEKAPGGKLPEGVEMGNAIEGTHLFGDDADVWACLISASVAGPVSDSATFRALVEYHWDRGAALLKEDYDESGQSDVEFVVRLAGMAPNGSGRKWTPTTEPVQAGGPLSTGFGAVSVEFGTETPVSFTLNSPGTSPHLAIMGRTRSGKSRTGLDIASSIVAQTDIPLILIDPKGEFVKNGELLNKKEWGGQCLSRFFPGIRPLDVPLGTIPLDFLWRSSSFTSHDLAQLAISFKDSFQKCIRSKGDVVLDILREAVLELLRTQRMPISLDDVLRKFNEMAEYAGKAAGGIGAKLGEINSLGMIKPVSAPAEFFSQRWVISFGSCSSEPKKLAIFLLLDALNSYLLSLPDSDVDSGGNRAIRHLLVVDEARETLSYRHGALSSLIRKSASKGGITVLLSQGPDDFDQEEDDFLEQMGTVGVFVLSSSSVKSLTGAFGKKMRVEDFADKNLPTGVAMVKFPGQPPKKVVAWK